MDVDLVFRPKGAPRVDTHRAKQWVHDAPKAIETAPRNRRPIQTENQYALEIYLHNELELELARTTGCRPDIKTTPTAATNLFQIQEDRDPVGGLTFTEWHIKYHPAENYTNLGTTEINLSSQSQSIPLPDDGYFIEKSETSRIEQLLKLYKQKTEAWSRTTRADEERLREELKEREQERERGERAFRLKQKQHRRSEGRKKPTKRARKRRQKEIAAEREAAEAIEALEEAREHAAIARARVRDANNAVVVAARVAAEATAAVAAAVDVDVKKEVGDSLEGMGRPGARDASVEKARLYYGWQLL